MVMEEQEEEIVVVEVGETAEEEDADDVGVSISSNINLCHEFTYS